MMERDFLQGHLMTGHRGMASNCSKAVFFISFFFCPYVVNKPDSDLRSYHSGIVQCSFPNCFLSSLPCVLFCHSFKNCISLVSYLRN